MTWHTQSTREKTHWPRITLPGKFGESRTCVLKVHVCACTYTQLQEVIKIFYYGNHFAMYAYIKISHYTPSVMLLSRVWLFVTPWITAHQASLSIINTQSLLTPMSIRLVMPSNHLILCHSLLPLPPIPPSTRIFPMSQLFAWGGQRIGVSALASALPMNTQDWSPLGWTDWISLQSKGLSRVFYNTIVKKHQFFSAQLSSQSNSHIHTWPLEKP